jgi:KaiC/GvpD/RAD55 family RecA-like ATPase
MLSPVESRPGQAVPGRFADHLATGRGKVTAENRKIVGLPPEIHRFFTNPGGHSMIVKGRAGTGKTTLVLQMLEEVFTGLDNFYLSSRVSDTALYKQFPWLLSKERNERLIHASKKFLDSLDRSREDGEVPLAAEDADMDALLMTAPPETDEVKSAKALLKEFRLLNGSFPVAVDRTELSRVEGMFEPPEIETMSDEGDGFTQFHNLVVDFDSDLPELERIYTRVESQLPKQICVAIDSIEALAEKYGIPEGRIINMLHKDLVENTNTYLVIVLEKFENVELDYYVDGVIHLEHAEIDGRAFREIIIQKLRGCETRHHRYLYTLTAGRMKAFGPYDFKFPTQGATWSPPEAKIPGRMPTGSMQLDAYLGGGLMEGSVNLLEVDRAVPTEAVSLFCMGPVLNALSGGQGVVWLPSREFAPTMLPPLVASYMGDGDITGKLRIVDLYPTDMDDSDPYMLGVEGDPIGNYLKWDVMRFNFQGVKGPTLNIMSYDALESVSGKIVDDMRDYYTELRQSGNVDLTIARASVRSTDRIADIAQQHLKLRKVHGALVLYGERPHTELLHFDMDVSEGVPRLHLTPIV